MAALATTLGNLALDVANWIGDPAGNRWPQTIATTPTPNTNPIQWYLCEAADRLNILSGIYHATVNVTVTGGTPTASVVDTNTNPPFGQILRIEDDTGKALIKGSSKILDTSRVGNWKGSGATATEQDQPTTWIRGLDGLGTVRLVPTPRRSATYVAFIVIRPAMMTSSAHYPFTANASLTADNPAHWHHALVPYASARCLGWNGDGRDEERAAKFMAEFLESANLAAAEVKAAMEV